MELTASSSNTLKVNTKKGAVLINPDSSEEAKIIILDDDADDISSKFPDSLVIYGPGEYEASGIMVKGKRADDKTMYEIDSGEGKILHALSTSISKVSTEDDFDAVVVRAISPVEEANLSSLSSKLVVVYGDISNIADSVKENKVNKINLRKLDDIASNVVFLEKK